MTSRDSLAGLVAVHGAHRLDLDLLPARDAYALLRRLIGPRADADPDATAALVGQCARLPLALRIAAELAAFRPRTPLAELVGDMADQQRRLDLLDAGGDPRVAVAAVFSWSVRHLPPNAARTFRLLGLHPGRDFDAYAVAALADTSAERARGVLDLLVRAHLVDPIGASRYGMHDLLRAYALGLATKDAAAGAGAARGRLFDYYLATAAAAMDCLHPAQADHRPRVIPAATAAPALAGPDAARRWLDSERHCLVAVVAYAATHGWPAHAVRLSATLYRYLAGGQYTDALAIHGPAREAARRTGDPAGEAQALVGLGTVHRHLGRYRTAAEHLEQALVLFRQAGDRLGEARATGNLGVVEEQRGCYEAAVARYQQALALFRQAGDPIGEAIGLDSLGSVERRLGRYAPAAAHHVRALALCRQAGDRNGEAYALDNLGAAEQRLGQHTAATAHHEQALSLCRQVGNRYTEAYVLHNLGILHTRLGRADQAIAHHQEALALFRDIGDREGQASALNGLGEAGQAADAVAHHTAALTIAIDTASREQQARAHTGLSRAYHTLGDPSRTRAHLERALTLYTDLGTPDADRIRADLAAAGAVQA